MKNDLELLSVTSSDNVQKADAIICLEGDGYNRADWCLKLFNENLADKIVVSGNYENPPFSINAVKTKEYLIRKGLKEADIILEDKSVNTKEQAEEVIKIAQKSNWGKIIIVASYFHQPRAYLTFIKALKDLKFDLLIFNSPAQEKNWFLKTSLGKTKLELLREEFEKIEVYLKKGDLVSAEEALLYQKYKESATP